jgi:hypothetical protein
VLLREKFIVAGSAIVLLALTACGGGDSKTVTGPDGEEVTIGTDLPDSFPDDFPVYDGADLQGAIQGEQDGIEGIVATWTTGDSLDDVAAFYDSEFEDGPWTVTLEGSVSGSTYWAVEHPDGKVGYISLAESDEVAIIATVGDDPDRASSDDGSSDDSDGESDDSSDDGSSDDEASSDDDDVSSDDDGGEVVQNLPDEVDLPDGFPTDLLSFPDDIRITTGTSYSANGQTTYMVGFFTEDSAKDVSDYYKSLLEGKGYNQSVQTSDATGVYSAYAENTDGTGTIIVVSVNDSTSVEGYREGVVQVTATE